MGASQTQWRLHCFVSRQKILKRESQAGNFFPWQSSLHEHNEPTIQGKSLYHPLTYGGGLHNPPNYETVYITFPKPVKLPPKAVLKNHSKSQKNHKMENLIVLDSK